MLQFLLEAAVIFFKADVKDIYAYLSPLHTVAFQWAFKVHIWNTIRY